MKRPVFCSLKNCGFVIVCLSSFASSGQMQVTLSPHTNTDCHGTGCNYYGTSVVINEVCTNPMPDNQLLLTPNGPPPGAAEWFELYNPDKCHSVDISCYFIGIQYRDPPEINSFFDVSKGGGFEIPQGSIIPPRGFALIRGNFAASVPSHLLVENGGRSIDIAITIFTNVCHVGDLCLGEWGGMIALYNPDGIPIDAVSWSDTVPIVNGSPCNPPGGCPYSDSLCSYHYIPDTVKNFTGWYPAMGKSFRRIPDAGAWDILHQGIPTPGNCNSSCIPPPIITCNGSASAAVSGGIPPYRYKWNDLYNQQTAVAVHLCEGTYCVTVTDAANNTATACTYVHDFKPLVSLDTFPSVCSTSPPINLSNGLPSGGTYSGNGVANGLFYPTVAGPGFHQIIYTYANNHYCIKADTGMIYVDSVQVANFAALPGLCVNSMPINLTSYGSPAGGTFLGPGVNGNSFNPGFSGAGNHTLSYVLTSLNSCNDTAISTIVVNSTPEVTLNPLDSICLYKDSVALYGGLPPGGFYYGNGVISNYFYPSQAGQGNILIAYSFTDTNNCTSAAISSIKVLPSPQVGLSPFPDICAGQQAFQLSGGYPPGGTYSGSGINAGYFNPAISGVGTFSVTYTVKALNDCENDTTQNITVYELPQVFNVSGGGEICDNASVMIIGLQGSQTGIQYTLMFNNAPAASPLMGTGNAIEFEPVGDTGYYYVNAIDTLSGCDTLMQGFATITMINDFNINWPDSAWLCDPAGLSLDAGSFTPDSVGYIWQDGSTNRYYTVTQPGVYSVMVGRSGCYGYDTIDVRQCRELRLPNVFTPDNDGINDRFLPKNPENIISYRIEIFNRWGVKVYESTDKFEGWDGTCFNHGTLCTEGAYYFIATYNFMGQTVPEESEISGSVTLIR